MKNKIKERDVVRRIFYICCPICNREIKGTNTHQVEYNLKLHLRKHKKNGN